MNVYGQSMRRVWIRGFQLIPRCSLRWSQGSRQTSCGFCSTGRPIFQIGPFWWGMMVWYALICTICESRSLLCAWPILIIHWLSWIAAGGGCAETFVFTGLDPSAPPATEGYVEIGGLPSTGGSTADAADGFGGELRFSISWMICLAPENLLAAHFPEGNFWCQRFTSKPQLQIFDCVDSQILTEIELRCPCETFPNLWISLVFWTSKDSESPPMGRCTRLWGLVDLEGPAHNRPEFARNNWPKWFCWVLVSSTNIRKKLQEAVLPKWLDDGKIW